MAYIGVPQEQICLAGKGVGERNIRPVARHYCYGTYNHFDLYLDLFDGRVIDAGRAKPTIRVVCPCLTVDQITNPWFWSTEMWPALMRLVDRWDVDHGIWRAPARPTRGRRARRRTRQPSYNHTSKG